MRIRQLTWLLLAAAIGVAALELLLGPADRRARHGADLEEIEIRSEAVDRTLPVKVVIPQEGGDGRPLLVFLHGRSSNGESTNVNDEMYAALRTRKRRRRSWPSRTEASRATGTTGRTVTGNAMSSMR